MFTASTKTIERFVALDTETTGVKPRSDRIIQFYGTEVSWPDLRPQGRMLSFVCDPGIPIPPAASRIHGYTNDDLAGQAPFTAYAHAVQEILDGACIISYNGRQFDVPLLHHELVRAGCKGLPTDVFVVDPCEIFRYYHPHSLRGALRHYAKKDHVDAHDAQADVVAMLQVLGEQIRRHSLPEVLTLALNPLRRPLDHEGCFYADEDGVVRLGIGQHRHEPAADRPDFLRWMLRRDFDEQTKKVARSCLKDLRSAS